MARTVSPERPNRISHLREGAAPAEPKSRTTCRLGGSLALPGSCTPVGACRISQDHARHASTNGLFAAPRIWQTKRPFLG